MEDLSGRQFGAYTIVAPLGEGGMAAVYRAYQPSVQRTVALKVLPQRLASEPHFQARFQLEARVVASLQHPHILPVFDYGESDGYTYFVMPYVAGGTLSRRLTGTPLPLPRVLDIMRQVCHALEYAHSKGVIHRDIKPSNILIDEGNNCLVADFGLAKLLESDSHLTTTRGLMGTPAYMAPEQAMGEPVTALCDIYSLSVVLYELLTGRVPYKAETPLAVAMKHAEGRLPLPRTFNASLPAALEQVMLRGLARDPHARYSTCLELYQALETASRIFGDASMGEVTDALPPTPREDSSGTAAPPDQPDVARPARQESVKGASAAPAIAPAPVLADMPLYPSAARAPAPRAVVRPPAHGLRNGALAAAATAAIAVGLWWALRPGTPAPSSIATSTSTPPSIATSTSTPSAVTGAPLPSANPTATPTVAPAMTQPVVTAPSSAPAAVAKPVAGRPPAASSSTRLTSVPAIQPQPTAQPAPPTTISASTTATSATGMTTSSASVPPTVSAPRVVTVTPIVPPATTSAAPAVPAAPSTGGSTSPRRIKSVPPVYPQEAIDAEVEGTVTLELRVNAQGKVVDAKVLKSIPLLDAAAITAVKQWEYEPTTALVGGQAIAIPLTVVVTVTFKMK